ncbi:MULTISPECIES: DUF177 domain-containing protein [unclassified Desulfovibrio]|uniref:YceD family protein n=1 Tax=unclassified Desulfovibrio TaxID=2593640 RepID=UPI000F5FF614|nr:MULTISPECIES: DUF177 domain-containing protein [unclassified Desulfovibrio]RRD72316.1 DUF177 domain-containing protein [Desulfovibrio sp. OH1209_COT-279]RRD88427.1 DUF177 domain-containing protein [Desulfovibrio sp. OH1186_COT-070]
MQNHHVSLNDLPREGKDFVVDDPAVWEDPIREFRMECRISSPLAARVHILPAGEGWLVRGTLAGEVVLPCSRCAEDAAVNLDIHFEDMAFLPEHDAGESDGAGEAQGWVTLVRGVPMLDLAAVCWEELALALPPIPLCAPRCKGLCSRCGTNLNENTCACPAETGDPRMAALRGVVLRKTGHS